MQQPKNRMLRWRLAWLTQKRAALWSKTRLEVPVDNNTRNPFWNQHNRQRGTATACAVTADATCMCTKCIYIALTKVATCKSQTTIPETHSGINTTVNVVQQLCVRLLQTRHVLNVFTLHQLKSRHVIVPWHGCYCKNKAEWNKTMMCRLLNPIETKSGVGEAHTHTRMCLYNIRM